MIALFGFKPKLISVLFSGAQQQAPTSIKGNKVFVIKIFFLIRNIDYFLKMVIRESFELQ